MTDYPHVTAGSSITSNLSGYAYQIQNWLTSTYPQLEPTLTNASASGCSTWNNLYRLDADVLASSPELVILDTANDANVTLAKGSAEAFIRRVWTARPGAKLVLVLPPAVTDKDVDASIDNPTNSGALQNVRDLADHYGIPYIDVQALFQTEIAGGHHLNEYMSDTIHWTAAGHTLCLNALKPILSLAFLTGVQLAGSLPARLYAYSADYEQAPAEKNGTAYDSRTGAWTDNGTSTSSNVVGATITYSGTLRSVGCDTGDGSQNPDVEISVDGGAYFSATLYQNGWEVSATRAAHTVTVKVLAGTVKIAKFWSI